MDIKTFYEDHGHKLWLVVAGAAAIILFIQMTAMIGTLIGHVILAVIVGGLIFGLDWRYGWQWLGYQRTQLGVAILLAVLAAISRDATGYVSGTILLLWDITMLMCVFSLSAVFFPNVDAIAERLSKVTDVNSAAAVLREGAGVGVAAAKRGANAAVEEGRGTVEHFTKRPGPAA